MKPVKELGMLLFMIEKDILKRQECSHVYRDMKIIIRKRPFTQKERNKKYYLKKKLSPVKQ